MGVTASLRRKPRVFYGWWVVAASTAGHALTRGTFGYGMSLFVKPLVEELQTTRAAVSGAFSLANVESGVLGPVEGFLCDKYGTRIWMLLGLALFGIGFILLGWTVNSILAFYFVGIGCLAVGQGFALKAGQVAPANWFVKKRSRAMGITSAGINIGGMAVPLLAMLINRYGWREASIIVGIISLVVAFPIAFFLRHKPEQFGLLPDGDEPDSATKGGEKISTSPARETRGRKRSPEEVDFTPAQALRTPAFYFLGIAFALRTMTVSALTLHFVPYLTDVGMSDTTAALMMGLLGWFGFMGRVGYGWLGDFFNKKYIAALVVGLMATSMLILPAVRSPWQTVGFLLLYAPAYGGGLPLMLALRGEYFGRKFFGTIGGLNNVLLTIGTFIGPILAGLVYDASGSYRIAFITFAFAGYLGTLLLLVMRRPFLKTPVAVGQ